MTPPSRPVPPQRPEDVDTGFWLWLVGLVLMVAAYVCDAVTAPQATVLGIGLAVLVVLMLAIVVVTFLVLMRSGYRWARTVLTAGAIVSIVHSVGSLFSVQRSTGPALIYAATAIVGAVLLMGGLVLLHRKDGHGYFTR